MFILRTINAKGGQSNVCLNKVYNYVTEHNTEEFEKAISTREYYGMEREKIYAFIIYDHGQQIIPLFKGQENYIMMSDGKTFANISFPKDI